MGLITELVVVQARLERLRVGLRQLVNEAEHPWRRGTARLGMLFTSLGHHPGATSLPTRRLEPTRTSEPRSTNRGTDR